ncbi:hypothetical protein AU255_09275 [Methyloprofundus sedimenti]|uniref:Lipoprotein n=1 Tax=Methyloprofundus sedimenti TaxID=1420851 RepID=A0A1V8M929_9GAMM|nr:hypothetical protein [Methyloprofundus sedimenti]OQK18026.1 hypothetical protein AU255_09275 [Methyloprofundus sedimenti]
MSIFQLIKIPIITFSVFNLLACVQQVDQQENIPIICVFPNQQAAPGWICGGPVSGLDIQAVGVVDKSVAGINYMQDMAEIAALKNLTELFKLKAGKSVTQYLTSLGVENKKAIKAGASTINNISVETLDVAKPYKSQLGPEGRMYVLVGLDKNTSKTLLENAVKTSMKNDIVIWQKMQTQKSLDEMTAGIVAMESVNAKQ